jgi:hypothetical protein
MTDPNPPTATFFNNDALALGGCRARRFRLQPGRDVAASLSSTARSAATFAGFDGLQVKLEPPDAACRDAARRHAALRHA